MSVLAYRWRTLAADTMGNDEGTIIGYVNKVGRTRDGWLWGACGLASAMEPFAEWAENRDGSPPEFDGNHSDHILISPEGVVKWWTGKGWIKPLPQEFHAWGCGRELAMGAMAQGADALQAVEIACRYDAFCRQPVTSVSIGVTGELDPLIDPPIIPEFDEVEGFEVGTEGGADTFAWVGDPLSPAQATDSRKGRSWRRKMGLE